MNQIKVLKAFVWAFSWVFLCSTSALADDELRITTGPDGIPLQVRALLRERSVRIEAARTADETPPETVSAWEKDVRIFFRRNADQPNLLDLEVGLGAAQGAPMTTIERSALKHYLACLQYVPGNSVLVRTETGVYAVGTDRGLVLDASLQGRVRLYARIAIREFQPIDERETKYGVNGEEVILEIPIDRVEEEVLPVPKNGFTSEGDANPLNYFLTVPGKAPLSVVVVGFSKSLSGDFAPTALVGERHELERHSGEQTLVEIPAALLRIADHSRALVLKRPAPRHIRWSLSQLEASKGVKSIEVKTQVGSVQKQAGELRSAAQLLPHVATFANTCTALIVVEAASAETLASSEVIVTR